jgi:ADP-heptose:LPS heptosyltransferase
MERNIEVKNFEHCCLWDLDALQSVLLQGCLAVGNDTGPLHLAGYLGVPVVSLFGPSSPAQWSPLGARVVQQDLACSPCSQTGSISCHDPVCMTTIESSAVQQAVCEVLEGAGSG